MLPASAVSGDRDRYCPYDITHVILAKSFDAHLLKCRENHPCHKKVVCPLDHTHVIPKPELKYHLERCDKRYLLDREKQKRADEGSLKGNVYGPPIVADHCAGDDIEENWDDAPSRNGPTPALFNMKPQESFPDSFGIIPGGGYVPPKTEEPAIRKIPNAPAQAARLSNPGSMHSMPARNQVFEFSIGSNRMPRMDIRPVRPSPLLPTPNGPPSFRMGGVRAPTANMGPKFIGRGISKYATKSKQSLPPSLVNSLPPQCDDDDDNDSLCSVPNSYTSSSTQWFEDVKYSLMDNDEVSANTYTNTSLPAQKLNNSQPGSGGGGGGYSNTINNQQLVLQQEILRHQKQQLEQLRQQHAQQQMELGKKHQLQLLQLQKLQSEEKTRLVQEQDKLEKELCLRSEAVNQSILSSPSLPPSLLSGLMSNLGISDLSNGFGNPASVDGAPVVGITTTPAAMQVATKEDTAVTQETWHETDEDELTESASESGADSGSNGKTRRKIQKKLKQIDVLEQKAALGHVLCKDEEKKLNSKHSLIKQLTALDDANGT